MQQTALHGSIAVKRHFRIETGSNTTGIARFPICSWKCRIIDSETENILVECLLKCFLEKIVTKVQGVRCGLIACPSVESASVFGQLYVHGNKQKVYNSTKVLWTQVKTGLLRKNEIVSAVIHKTQEQRWERTLIARVRFCSGSVTTKVRFGSGSATSRVRFCSVLKCQFSCTAKLHTPQKKRLFCFVKQNNALESCNVNSTSKFITNLV